jgi:hypothetical protein
MRRAHAEAYRPPTAGAVLPASACGRLAVLLLTTVVLLASAGAAQAAPKGTIGFLPASGATDQFSTPGGVAVNEETRSVYVVDSGNHRIQQFDELGELVRIWGWGVETGAPAFERCEAPAPCLSGQNGPGPGQLSSPGGIAVNQDTGFVYVTSRDNRRIEVFDENGFFQYAFGWGVATGAAEVERCTSTCQAAAGGSEAGQFGDPFTGHIAVDPGNGDVVVADPGNVRAQRFDSEGVFRFAFGWGVDTGAFALEQCTTASTCQAGWSGDGIGQFAFSQPVRIAVDGSGAVYTVEPGGNGRVQKFNPAATSAGVFAPEETAGTSAETVPTDVGVHPGSGHVFVARGGKVLEFGVLGELVETHAPEGGLPQPNGMAVESSRDRIYLSTSVDQRVLVLDEVTPPSATSGLVTNVTATTARFTGTVNPNNGVLPTGYRFEYSDDGGQTWTAVPETDVPAGDGTSDVDAAHDATGLEPNTEYLVRLVARRPLAGGMATSAATTFSTDPAGPSVSQLAAREVTDTTAVLTGQIDANRSHTTYVFEYGPDTNYGNATTVDSAGSGASAVPVSKVVSGLLPNTTYHFRLVATNPAGVDESPDGSFTTRAEPAPPSGRVYEMVSPVDKNGGNIERDRLENVTNHSGASESGEAVAFVSPVAFGDVESAPPTSTYVARRAPDGWATRGVSPAIANATPQAEFPRIFGLSPDLLKAFVHTSALLTPDASTLNGSFGLYRRNLDAGPRYDLLSRPGMTLDPEQPGLVFSRFEYIASTPDSRHVVFSSSRALLPPPAPPDRSTTVPNAVYEWVDGAVRLVSVPPPGLQLNPTGAAGPGNGDRPSTNGTRAGEHIVSGDGRRVYFEAAARRGTSGLFRTAQLFVREDGADTRWVSEPELGVTNPPVPNNQTEFLGARAQDGAVAFFTSSQPLTLGAGTGTLYRWDANAPAGARLTELSRDDPAVRAPRVQGAAGVSDDARSVYFVAEGVLAPGATRDEPNLYLWREGETAARFIATLVDADNDVWDNPVRRGGSGARISADGERLLFASTAKLDDDYDISETDAAACGDPAVAGENCRQLYVYDARSGEISCVTCAAGIPMTADANLFAPPEPERTNGAGHAPTRSPRNLSPDGTRVFFETARPLVSGDLNTVRDVYEWEDTELDGDGWLRLLSPGRSAHEAKFLDASASGDDVFFTTRERLVGIDTDDQIDLYDARVDGGIPAQNPPAPAPPCEGEACQGTASGAPFLVGVGSDGATNGDARPGPRASFSMSRLTARQRARLARGLPVTLRVRVNRAGRVSLTARAKLRKRTRTVDKASRRARKAGRVGLMFRLSPAAQAKLRRERRLSLTLAVRFSGVREPTISTVTLRRAESTARRGSR